MGRDLSSSSSRSKRKEFQSTRPRGARLDLRQNDGTGSRFQSTRPRGARRARLTALLCSIQSFNPRAHVGRDDGGSFLGGAYGVSIHAPTWGATVTLCYPLYCLLFQSTRPRGARHLLSGFMELAAQVSIHAPTWGATAFGINAFGLGSFMILYANVINFLE